MGCISSKSSNDEQTDNHEIDPDHRHDEVLSTDVENKEHGSLRWSLAENKSIVERCSSFHTVEEYDELLQGISSSKDDDAEVVGVPDINLDQPVKKDCDDESGIKGNNTDDVEFQTVASLRQWLHSPSDPEADANANADTDYPTSKTAFGFYDNNTETPVEKLVLVETGKKQEDETIIELVVAFDQYMQQLQIEEDHILKHIHNITD